MNAPIRERTQGEKEAYVQGYERALNDVVQHGLVKTQAFLASAKQSINLMDNWRKKHDDNND